MITKHYQKETYYIRYINPYQKMSKIKRYLRYIYDFFSSDSHFLKYNNIPNDYIFKKESVDDVLQKLLRELNRKPINKAIDDTPKYKLIHNDIFCITGSLDSTNPLNINNVLTNTLEVEPFYISKQSEYKLNTIYILDIDNRERFEILKDEYVKKLIRKDKIKKLNTIRYEKR